MIKTAKQIQEEINSGTFIVYTLNSVGFITELDDSPDNHFGYDDIVDDLNK